MPREPTTRPATSTKAVAGIAAASSSSSVNDEMAVTVGTSVNWPSSSDFVRGDGDAQLGDDVGTLPGERLRHRLPGVPSTRSARTDHGDWLAVHVARADQPIERVLDRTGHPAGVLRSGHEHDIGGVDAVPPVLDHSNVLVVAVGVERRDVRQAVEVVDGRPPCRSNRPTQQRSPHGSPTVLGGFRTR